MRVRFDIGSRNGSQVFIEYQRVIGIDWDRDFCGLWNREMACNVWSDRSVLMRTRLMQKPSISLSCFFRLLCWVLPFGQWATVEASFKGETLVGFMFLLDT